MKRIIGLLTICLFAMVSQSFADKDWDNLVCSENLVSEAKSFIQYYESRIRSADGYIKRCSGQPAGSCVTFLVDKGYSPSTASSSCKGISAQNLDCLKDLINKGYSPSTSNESCRDLSQSGSQCVSYVVSKGYSPSTARSSCANVNSFEEYECIKALIEKGYSPSTAASSCSK